LFTIGDCGIFLPYKETIADIKKLGFVASFEEAEKMIREQVMSMTEDEVFERRRNILRLVDTHFTPQGVMDQLEKWFDVPVAAPGSNPHSSKSDLRCCSADIPPEARRESRCTHIVG